MKKFYAIIVVLLLNLIFEFLPVYAEKPDFYIKAINPGYTVDGTQNVGEFIEIARPHSDSLTPISLAGLALSYFNSSGNPTTLLEFPVGSTMTGESILLRLASSPDSELANLNYAKTLAMKAGPLELTLGGEVIDSVCWTGKAGCSSAFSSDHPTALVRENAESPFSHLESYLPAYSPDNYYEEKTPEESIPPQCQNLQFSEILSYYESSQSEQFIEFYNPTAEQIPLKGCSLKYKNKFYALNGLVSPDSYFTYYPTEFALTKNPTTENRLDLIDTDGTIVDTLVYKNGQKKSMSYAQLGYDEKGQELWRSTYSQTPSEPNVFQEYKTCEDGKVINLDTGNCVKKTTITETVCPAGKYLNPLTGRCKSYETEASEKVCAEGYELNPETNRCRKIKINDGADYSLEPETYQAQTTFTALYIIIAIIALGCAYIIFQFRHEIKKFFDKVFRRAR